MIAASALWIICLPISSRQVAISASAVLSISRSASVSSPGVGIWPSQFLTIIDSERLARLPIPLARSALIRIPIASSLQKPSWPKEISRIR
ncbi:hypothetical protein D3C73_1241070 [compost metagenome]